VKSLYLKKEKMKATGIIPARYNSTRLPGKPLLLVKGMSMIQRVYEQAKKASSLKKVIVATDDERIFNHVNSFGGSVVYTSADHLSGTDRCFEAATNAKISDPEEIIVNIQGDEPYIDPEQIDLLVSCFQSDTNLATLVKKISETEEIFNPSKPKVIVSKNLNAIYFSRSPIPFVRAAEKTEWLNHVGFYKHIGIYGYSLKTLKEIIGLPSSPLELAEALEQLRWIENGFSIKVAITDQESISIDTQEDLDKINAS
jgi:3-deoxy-manno-octulosonate cytidylyltransferase (CMP-KDO synthetase)